MICSIILHVVVIGRIVTLIDPNVLFFGAAFFIIRLVGIFLKNDVLHTKRFAKSLNFGHQSVADGEAEDHGNENANIKGHNEQHDEETESNHRHVDEA